MNRSPQIPKRFYTPMEAAQSIGVGRTWIYEALKDGRLKSIKVNKKRLIPSEDLDAYAQLLIDEARRTA